jgi:hypothetical protein
VSGEFCFLLLGLGFGAVCFGLVAFLLVCIPLKILAVQCVVNAPCVPKGVVAVVSCQESKLYVVHKLGTE